MTFWTPDPQTRVEHTSNCACYGRGPEAIRNHEALLKHNPSCAQCRAAHGKEEMCEVGRSFYLAMLAAMDRWHEEQRTDLTQLRAQLATAKQERDWALEAVREAVHELKEVNTRMDGVLRRLDHPALRTPAEDAVLSAAVAYRSVQDPPMIMRAEARRRLEEAVDALPPDHPARAR